MRRLFYIVGFILVFHLSVISIAAASWKELKGNHFIIYYDPAISGESISEILRAAEGYYDKVADQIGYTRYDNYWTWDNRAKIYLYPDQKTFIAETGLPDWTAGASGRDTQLTNSRMIAAYMQEEDFIGGVLPHEIAHLILHDFLSEREIPLWFDEGMAQLQEEKKLQLTRKYMPKLVAANKYLPMTALFISNVRLATDQTQVTIFYLQSISVLDFLMQEYGTFKFRELCIELKTAKSFEAALERVYGPYLGSVDELEKKWLSYMKKT